MSTSDQRRERILELARRHGFVAIEDLARRFAVTTQTIRRDVNQLCEQALLRRYHGGAGLPSSVENLAYSARQVLCLEEKRRIAALEDERARLDADLASERAARQTAAGEASALKARSPAASRAARKLITAASDRPSSA